MEEMYRQGRKKTPRQYRMTKRKEQARETREKIYQSALELINEKGFPNVSIKEITDRAGISSGSFYSYFDSKEDLIFYTFSESDAIYQQAYERNKEKDVADKMESFLYDAYCTFEKRGVGIMKAIVMNYFSFPDYDFYSEDRALIRCINAVVEEGKKQGQIQADLASGDIVRVLITILAGVEMMWCLDNGSTNLGEMVRDNIRMMVRGMLPPE